MLPGDEFGIVTPEEETEKVDFPITEKPMPTFHAAYGAGIAAGGPSVISSISAVAVPRHSCTR